MARVIKGDGAGDAAPHPAVMNLADIAAEARGIVVEARNEAARIVGDARAQAAAAAQAAAEHAYAEGFACGRDDGYAEGYRRGRNEARDAFAARAEELTAQARQVVQELAAARAELLHQARCDLLQFALELAERIVGRIAATDIAAARANLQKVLELAGSAGRVSVKVHPSQLDRLREDLPELVEALGFTGQVVLAGDGRISPGGVKLLTAQGQIDATVETQLANVAEALLGRPDVRTSARQAASDGSGKSRGESESERGESERESEREGGGESERGGGGGGIDLAPAGGHATPDLGRYEAAPSHQPDAPDGAVLR